MFIFKVPQLEVEVQADRCRVNHIATSGAKKYGTWIALPVTHEQLSLGSPTADLAVVVRAYELSGGRDLRLLLTNRASAAHCP
jgi:hypothetical protein